MDHCLHPCSSSTFTVVHAAETVPSPSVCTGAGKAVCPACIDSTVTQTGQWENVEPVLAHLAVCRAVCRPNPHKEQGVPHVCPLFSEGWGATLSLPFCLQNVLHFSV